MKNFPHVVKNYEVFPHLLQKVLNKKNTEQHFTCFQSNISVNLCLFNDISFNMSRMAGLGADIRIFTPTKKVSDPDIEMFDAYHNVAQSYITDCSYK